MSVFVVLCDVRFVCIVFCVVMIWCIVFFLVCVRCVDVFCVLLCVCISMVECRLLLYSGIVMLRNMLLL